MKPCTKDVRLDYVNRIFAGGVKKLILLYFGTRTVTLALLLQVNKYNFV